MRITLDGQVLAGGRVAEQVVSRVNKKVFEGETVYLATEKRVRKLASELVDIIDLTLADYFETLADRILAQGRGGPGMSGNTKFKIPKYDALSDRHFREKQRMLKSGRSLKHHKNTGFLAQYPKLAARRAFYAYTGKTEKKLRSTSTRAAFGRTTYYITADQMAKARKGRTQIGSLSPKAEYGASELMELVFGTLTFTLTPKISKAIEETVYGQGPDNLGHSIFKADQRMATIMAGGRAGHTRRLASPVFAYYLRTKVPNAINKFMGGRARTLLYLGAQS